MMVCMLIGVKRQPPEAVPWAQLTYGLHAEDQDRLKE
jgi:hypothetical protein